MYVFIFIKIRDLNRSRLIFIKRCAQKVVWAVCSSKRREDHFFIFVLTVSCRKIVQILENYDGIVIDVLDF